MIKSQFLRFLASFVKGFKSFWWNRTYNENNVKVLNILQGDPGKFHMFGDIARILYSDQHLVSRKKSFEYETLDMYKNMLSKGDIVFDIGANIGLFSVLGSKYVGDKGKIYAFEPTRKTFEYLEKNLAANNIKNVSAHRIAFSNEITNVVMSTPQGKETSIAGDSYNQIQEATAQTASEDVIETQLLDDFVKENNINKVDVLKIDIEGAEYLCFQGGLKFLKEVHPKIIFECYEEFCNKFNHRVFNVLSLLEDCGYEVHQFNHAQWIAEPKKK